MHMPTLYNHAPAACGTGNAFVPGFHEGACQALVLSWPDDVVQLPVRLQDTGGLEWMRGHYGACGIAVAGRVTFCDAPVIARSVYPAPDYALSVSLFTSRFDEERPDLNWLRAVKTWSSAGALAKVCHHYGIPTLPETLNGGHPEMIEVHYQLESGTAEYLGTTERVRTEGELAHVASGHDVRYITDVLAQRALTDGLRGYVTFSLGVACLSGGRKKYLVHSCYPGCREPLYAAVAVARLSGVRGGWEYRVIGTKYRCYDELPLRGIEYDPDRGTGVLVIKWGTLLWGHLGVLLVGAPEVRSRTLAVLKSALLS